MKEKQKAFTKEDEKKLYRYLFGWMASIYVIGFLIAEFRIPIDDIPFFHSLSQITPAIDIWTVLHYDKHVARAVWLYVTYTGPFLLIFLLVKIKAKPIKIPVFLSLISLIVISTFGYFLTELTVFGKLFGSVFTPSDFDYDSMAAKVEFIFKTTSGAITFAALSGVAFVGVYHSVAAYFLALIRNRFLLEENTHG